MNCLQGAFDRKTSLKATITVFALSLMTSSTFIYNLDENIQEDDLQHLQFFTNYGKLALDESGDAPFQKLAFLVRDWQFPYEKAFGAEGGKQLLDATLKVEKTRFKFKIYLSVHRLMKTSLKSFKV